MYQIRRAPLSKIYANIRKATEICLNRPEPGIVCEFRVKNFSLYYGPVLAIAICWTSLTQYNKVSYVL